MSDTPEMRPYPHGRRGFASMSRDKRRRIASLGGKASHQAGTAHRWTPEEAQAAGRVGGARGKRGPAKKVS